MNLGKETLQGRSLWISLVLLSLGTYEGKTLIDMLIRSGILFIIYLPVAMGISFAFHGVGWTFAE